MKVVFLDIDGVLNSRQFIKALYHQNGKGGLVREFCPICSSNLVYILSEVPDAKIVVSSSWRISTSLEELRDILNEQIGVEKDRVIDVTLNFSPRGRDRGYEIQDWLDLHPEVTKFVILDDSSDMAHLMPYLVRTKWDLGLMIDKADEAIKMLVPESPCCVCGVMMNHHHGGICQPCLVAKIRQESLTKIVL